MQNKKTETPETPESVELTPPVHTPAERFLHNIGRQLRDAVKSGVLPPNTYKVNATLKSGRNGQYYWEMKAVDRPLPPLVGQCRLFNPTLLDTTSPEAKKLSVELCPDMEPEETDDGLSKAERECKADALTQALADKIVDDIRQLSQTQIDNVAADVFPEATGAEKSAAYQRALAIALPDSEAEAA